MPKKKKTDDLLTFDEDSPLFVKKKKTSKKKPKYESEAEAASKPTAAEIAAKKKKRKTKPTKEANPNVPKYIIRGPSDCKHLSATAKKLIVAKWILLEDGNNIASAEISNWLRGFASVIKESRPKEYEEMKVLIYLAKEMAQERNKSDDERTKN